MVAEEMQAVSKGLEKVEQELSASESDGAVSMGFQKVKNVYSFLSPMIYICFISDNHADNFRLSFCMSIGVSIYLKEVHLPMRLDNNFINFCDMHMQFHQ